MAWRRYTIKVAVKINDGILIICWRKDALRPCRPIVPPAGLRGAYAVHLFFG